LSLLITNSNTKIPIYNKNVYNKNVVYGIIKTYRYIY
jgi:hypothetical protein